MIRELSVYIWVSTANIKYRTKALGRLKTEKSCAFILSPVFEAFPVLLWICFGPLRFCLALGCDQGVSATA